MSFAQEQRRRQQIEAARIAERRVTKQAIAERTAELRASGHMKPCPDLECNGGTVPSTAKEPPPRCRHYCVKCAAEWAEYEAQKGKPQTCGTCLGWARELTEVERFQYEQVMREERR